MDKDLHQPKLLPHDGTSQGERPLKALDPATVPVDGRDLGDLLRYAAGLGPALQYFAVDGKGLDEKRDDKPAGDWSALVPNDPAMLARLAAFAEDPSRFEPGKNPELFAPHRVLLLTFLRLLRRVQGQLDTFGRRHLDFYYHQVLALEPRPAEPDRVTVFFELEEDGDPVELEAGTLLDAGQDDQGEDRVYATERDLVVSQAQIAQLSSLHIDYRVTDFLRAREETRDPGDRALALFGLALGDPRPGDPLADYPLPSQQPVQVTWPLLQGLEHLVAFCQDHLFMELADLRDMMGLKARRDQSSKEWKRINGILEKVARNRGSSLHITPLDSKEFHHNLVAAVGSEPDYDGLPDVTSIYQLYAHRDRADVQTFVIGLHFTLDDFAAMMQIKVGIDSQWTRINTLLQAAGRSERGDTTFRLPYLSPETDPPASETRATNFTQNLQLALGTPDFSQASSFHALDSHLHNIDDYHQTLLALESYFDLLAEEFAFVMANLGETATSPKWQIVDRLLDKAHREKIFKARRQQIHTKIAAHDLKTAILFVLGETHSKLDMGALLAELRPYLRDAADAEFMAEIAGESWSQVSPDEKQRVYEILEQAQSTRQHFVPPPAQQETWRNLYLAADATRVLATDIASKSESGDAADDPTDLGGSTPPWKTFGATPPPPAVGQIPTAHLGWALSSPTLTLGGGQRQLTLTLGLTADLTADTSLTTLLHSSLVGAASPLCFEASTAKGWLEPSSATGQLGHVDVGGFLLGTADPEAPANPDNPVHNALVFTLTWLDTADPIVPLGADFDGGMGSPWPVLRMRLRPIEDSDDIGYHALYPVFRDLRLLTVGLHVQVSGLLPAAFENDENPLDPGQPFEPFGDTPTVGSRFRIGYPELALQNLDGLTFHVQWMGAPADFSTYYANYPAATLTDIGNGFKAAVNLVDRDARHSLEPGVTLFESNPNAAHTMPIGRVTPDAPVPRDLDATEGDRWLEWQLATPDFQHQAYPSVASLKAIEMAAAISRSVQISENDAKTYQVNPPYTPKIQSLGLDYTASLTLDPTVATANTTGANITDTDGLFHLHPFGYAPLDPSVASAANPGIPLLPRYDNEGELYIGLQGVEAPQGLTLFFQLDADSADSDLPPEPIVWSALSGNRWLDLGEGQIVRDTTRGLINSGIVELLLDPVEPSTLLPGGLYWLRAAVARGSASLCNTLAIHCQAVEAVFLDQGNDPTHYDQPLPAGSIAELMVEQADIAAVHQPYTSYGSRPAEPANGFDTRVSERLRHKDRALQGWDYERLVLGHFPQIYKAKCLPADLAAGDGLVFPTPGALRVVVLPDIRGQLPFEPFEPKAPSDVLGSIQELLDARSPTFAQVTVQNARFVTVLLRMWVHFTDRGYARLHINQLNEALKRFLSPWAYEEGADIVIGGRIYANSLLDFVDRQPYVDFVEDLKFFTSLDGEHFAVVPALQGDARDQGYFVKTTAPDQVLVTARRHQILPFFLDGGDDGGGAWQSGIGHMTVGLDFIVDSDPGETGGQSLGGIGSTQVGINFDIG